MERRERDTNSSIIEIEPSKDETKSMIDITFRMKENDMFADVKVFSFNLILSMDYLMKLSAFLQPMQNSTQNSADIALEQREVEAKSRRKSSFSGAQQAQQQEIEKKAVFAIHIEEYDIILVEKMDDINCLALILNVSCACHEFK